MSKKPVKKQRSKPPGRAQRAFGYLFAAAESIDRAIDAILDAREDVFRAATEVRAEIDGAGKRRRA